MVGQWTVHACPSSRPNRQSSSAAPALIRSAIPCSSIIRRGAALSQAPARGRRASCEPPAVIRPSRIAPAASTTGEQGELRALDRPRRADQRTQAGIRIGGMAAAMLHAQQLDPAVVALVIAHRIEFDPGANRWQPAMRDGGTKESPDSCKPGRRSSRIGRRRERGG